MKTVLELLNEDYEYQYSPKWIKPKRYDFYIKNKNLIIEVDGGLGHGNNKTIDNKTPEETKAIDDYKDKMAEKNGINVIRINCFKSEWNFIKNNIMNSNLPNLLGFKEDMVDKV